MIMTYQLATQSNITPLLVQSKPMVHKLGVTLEELYGGKTRKLAATRDIICSGCNGKGGSNVKNCTGCKGRGVSGTLGHIHRNI